MSNEKMTLEQARQAFGRAGAVTVDGKEYVFRPPTFDEWDAYQAGAQENETRGAAARAIIADCYCGDRSEIDAAMRARPFLIMGTDGFLSTVNRLAGKGASAVRFV